MWILSLAVEPVQPGPWSHFLYLSEPVHFLCNPYRLFSKGKFHWLVFHFEAVPSNGSVRDKHTCRLEHLKNWETVAQVWCITDAPPPSPPPMPSPHVVPVAMLIITRFDALGSPFSLLWCPAVLRCTRHASRLPFTVITDQTLPGPPLSMTIRAVNAKMKISKRLLRKSEPTQVGRRIQGKTYITTIQG